MIRILTDSAADLEPSDYDKYGIELIPLTVTIDRKTYRADCNFNREDFFRLLEASEIFPKTSQPSPAEFEEIFSDARQKGDELIYVSVAAALSGSNQSANAIKGMDGYDNVSVFDSCSASCALKLMVIYAAELRNAGKTVPEIMERLKLLRPHVRIYACLDTLEYLRRGGRLSSTAAGLGALARIKPVVTFASDGGARVIGKGIGTARAMKELCSIVTANPPDPAWPIYGLYSGSTENLEALLRRPELQGIEVPEDHRTCLGPAVGTHIGPNACGIIYVEKF